MGPPLSRLDLLTIATDEGIEGHTFAGAPGEDVAGPIVRQVRPMLIGQDPLDIGRIWARTGQRGLPASLQGAVDVALWDITGKAAGLPVHRLLGTVRDRIPAYTSSWVHDAGQSRMLAWPCRPQASLSACSIPGMSWSGFSRPHMCTP
jgi:L-alanine-DL-glutamate epimerase-like enolase superfamily enzyme